MTEYSTMLPKETNQGIYDKFFDCFQYAKIASFT